MQKTHAGNLPRGLTLQEARKWYEQAVQKNPSNGELWYGYGHVLFEHNRDETNREAIQKVRKALDLAPQNAHYLNPFLVDLHLELRDHAGAVEVLDTMKDDRTTPYAFWSSALVLFALSRADGEDSDARAYANKALKRAVRSWPGVAEQMLLPVIPVGGPNQPVKVQYSKGAENPMVQYESQMELRYLRESILFWNRTKGAKEWVRKMGLPYVEEAKAQRLERLKVPSFDGNNFPNFFDGTFQPPASPQGKPALVKRCSACSKLFSGAMRCSGCTGTYYCNRSCQKSHWAVHKKTCARKQEKKEGKKEEK
jgi:tetratricopeptide (TPR) repeat protein